MTKKAGQHQDQKNNLNKANNTSFNDKVEEDGFNDLHRAILSGELDNIKCLIEAGANTRIYATSDEDEDFFVKDIHKKVESYNLAHLAMMNGKEEIIQYIAKEFPLMFNECNYYGVTPVAVAVGYGNIPAVKFFFNDIADTIPAFKIEDGDVAVVLAVLNNHREIVEILLRHGYNINDDAWLLSADSILEATIKDGDLSASELALDNGALIDKVGRDGYTALNVAIKEENLKAVEFLLWKGASLFVEGAKNNFGLILKADSAISDLIKTALTVDSVFVEQDIPNINNDIEPNLLNLMNESIASCLFDRIIYRCFNKRQISAENIIQEVCGIQNKIVEFRSKHGIEKTALENLLNDFKYDFKFFSKHYNGIPSLFKLSYNVLQHENIWDKVKEGAEISEDIKSNTDTLDKVAYLFNKLKLQLTPHEFLTESRDSEFNSYDSIQDLQVSIAGDLVDDNL